MKTTLVVYPVWGVGRAYTAERPFTCAGFGCKKPIKTGDLYTLHRVLASPYTNCKHGFCKSCIPFSVVNTDTQGLVKNFSMTPHHLADKEKYEESQPGV